MAFSDLGKSELVDLLINRPVEWNEQKRKWNEENKGTLTYLDLSGVSFEEKALEGVDLKQVNLSGCSFIRATLKQISFFGSNLCGADFKHSAMNCVDLSGSTGLQESVLACTELKGCRLPEGFEFEGPAIVLENAKGTRTVYFVLLVGLLTCLSTLFGLEDFDIVSDKGKAALPFATALVPVKGFLCLGPAIIMVVFLYFCISLMNLRTNLSALPRIFPSGKTRNERCSHWILSFLAFAPLQPPEAGKIPFPKMIRVAACLCEKVMVPLGFFIIWLCALKRHDFWLSFWHLFFVFFSSAVAWVFGKKAEKLPDRATLGHRNYFILGILMIVVFSGLNFFSFFLFNTPVFENRGKPKSGTSFFDVNIYKKKFTEISSEGSGEKDHLHGDSQVDSSMVDGNIYIRNSPEVSSEKLGSEDSSDTERDVIEAQLEGRNFNFAKADHAFFFKAKLKNAQFQSCQLKYAHFGKADLSGANFQKANLNNADLRNAKLSEADFRGAHLVSAQLDGSVFTKAKLQNAFLNNQDLQNLEMGGAKFQGAHLEGANFRGSKIQGADFQEAFLTGANFESVRAKEAKFNDRNLIGSSFIHADLRNANFNGADLSQAIFTKASLKGAAFKEAQLIETHFDQAALGEAKLQNAKLWRADLTGALLWKANFEGAELVEADLRGIRHWKAASWKGANIFGVKNPPEGFREWALDQGAVEIEVYIHDFLIDHVLDRP